MSDSDGIKFMKIMGLTMALPSTIIGVSYFAYLLIEKGIIPSWLGLVIILVAIGNIFFLIIRGLKNKKD